jgi:D-alanine-D-alanine ligase
MPGTSAESLNSSCHVLVLYNAPALPADHRDYASEAGVLESVAAVSDALSALGHRVTKLSAGGSAAALVEKLQKLQPDIVFNLCESFGGRADREPHIASLLELLGIPFTGSPSDCLMLARDKPRTKRLLAATGLPTAEFVEVGTDQQLPENPLRGWLKQSPLFVKPSREDASLGIDQSSICKDWESLSRQIAAIQQRFGEVLVERYIAGREFNVGIVGFPQQRVLAISEIEFQISEELPWPILTYAGKWSPGSSGCQLTPVRCPANIDSELANRLKQTALAAYRTIGCRDYARIDFRVDEHGRVFVLEVNANPDIGPSAGFARMLQAAEVSYQEFVGQLLVAVMGRDACPSRKAGAAEEDGLAAERKVLPVGGIKNQRREPSRAVSVDIRTGIDSDRAALLEITRACGVFCPEEIEIADEVMRDGVANPPVNGYWILIAELEDRPVGWSCHGRVPLTDATFDLYWIAVAPEYQGAGIGKQLLAEVERQVAGLGGRWLLAETSSLASYHATREFYTRSGYSIVSQIADFYRLGDDKITFGKRLDRGPIS